MVTGMMPGQDRDGDAGRPGAFDEAEVVVGVPEQLGDREVGAGDLLREQRVDVLRGAAGARMPRRERGDGDALGSRTLADLGDAGETGDAHLRERLPLLLHAVDELHQLGGAVEVADARVGIGPVRRVTAQGEEARDARVEELAHEAVRLGVRRSDAGEVRHRLDVGVLEHVAEHRERAVARGAPCAERHRDERGTRLGEAVDRAPQGERSGIRSRREQLERDRRPTVGAPGVVSGLCHGAPAWRAVSGSAEARQAASPGRNRRVGVAGGCRARLSLQVPGIRPCTDDHERRYAFTRRIRPL